MEPRAGTRALGTRALGTRVLGTLGPESDEPTVVGG